MTTDVKVPASGESVTSASIARWHQNHGDTVRRGEPLVTLETDKISSELEADHDGALEILVGEGEEVAIGTTIGRIRAEAGAQGDAKPAAPEPEAEPEPAAPAPEPAAAAASAPPSASAAPAEAVEIKVPASGESVTSANVASWLKKDGDSVVAGETVVVLETDKVSNELEAPVAGTLRILVPVGEEVVIGTPIARILPGPVASPAPAAPPAAAPVAKPATVDVPKDVPKDVPPARESGSGQNPPQGQEEGGQDGGQSPPPPDGRTTRRKMSMLRRKIATQLVNAQRNAAILTTFNEVDMSAVMEMRKASQEEFVKKYGVKLGFMSFFAKAVVRALQDVPSINARIDGTDIVQNHYYDIGVAIGTERGLVVPVLRAVDQKSFAQIENDILDYANKARQGSITLADMRGGVFSISNGGTYGSLLSTPILNPPQSAILGMHAIQQRPVAVNGKVEIRPMMYLALSYDHRLVDGKEAVTFLIRIKECIEVPSRLMLEM